MKLINIREILESKNSSFLNKTPEFAKQAALNFLNRVICADEINEFLSNNYDKIGIDFIDELFEYLDFSYRISSADKLNIPSEGKLICAANHPLGALDGLSLVKAIYEVRKDVKIVANDVLVNIENLSEFFLPYDIFSKSSQKKNIQAIDQALQNDEAVIFFPAAEVSRFGPKGVRDSRWSKGALKFALKHNAPILPILIQAYNSPLFYAASILHRSASLIFLPNELFNKKHKTIDLKIGSLIPSKSLTGFADLNAQSKLLKKHLYKLNKKNAEIFKTEKTIIHPVDPKIIREELADSLFLGETKDGKHLYCADYSNAKNTVKEIARLREITFRKVGEGAGQKCDMDKFDAYYKHIVLWNDKDLEIVGSYRIGVCGEIIDSIGYDGLYNSEEFELNENMENILKNSLEMGRSFIQQKYWRSSALDYLWQGIGAFLKNYSNIEYLFGAVSISDVYADEAKAMIVYYYSKWRGADHGLQLAKNKYCVSKNYIAEFNEMFIGESAEEDFRILKSNLKNMGYSVPVMFKRYTELCEAEGIKFLDFNIDKNFSNCVDGLIILEIDKIKNSYKQRYGIGIVKNEVKTSDSVQVGVNGELIGQLNIESKTLVKK
jgi:putative hemolysin